MAWPVGYTTLPPLTADASFAYGASLDGAIVVGASRSADGSRSLRMVYWTEAGITELGHIVALQDAIAIACSSDGSVIVGYGQDTFTDNHGIRWTQAGGLVDIGTVPGATAMVVSGCDAAGDVIVGTSDQTFPARWTQATGWLSLGLLPGDTFGAAAGVSADGTTVVGFSGSQAFRWTLAGGMVGLGFIPGDSFSAANAVSADGSVVAGTGTTQAFRWTQATGAVALSLPAGTTFAVATSISADGNTIIGGVNDAITNQLRPFMWTQGGGAVVLPQIAGQAGQNYDSNAISAGGAVIVGDVPLISPVYQTAFVYGLAAASHTVSVADLWFGATAGFVDLAVAANRRKFVGLGGSAQFLGSDGSRPFGAAPPVFLTRPSSGSAGDTFADNAGLGAAFAITGGDLATASPGPACATYRVALDVPPNTPSGADPQIMLSVSDNGGRSFSALQKWRSMGKIGQYRKRLRWLKMGKFRQRVIRLEITDPVRRNLVGFYVDLTEGLE